jgi:hypothetical protein
MTTPQLILLGFLVGSTTAPAPVCAATSLRDIAYGNGIFVAVGSEQNAGTSKPYCLFSADGALWTAGMIGGAPYSPPLSGVAFGTNLFVAVGGQGLMTSNDGRRWHPRVWDSDPYLYDVVYARSTFVAVGGGNAVLTSPDGTTWTAQRLSASYWLNWIAFGNGLFVAAGPPGTVLVSTDAVVWTPWSTDLAFEGLTFGNGRFVAVTSPYPNGAVGIWTSVNGQNWVLQRTLDGQSTAGVSSANGLFFLGRTDDRVEISADALQWTTANGGLWPFASVAYGGGLFIGIGTRAGGASYPVTSSPDGIVWTRPTEPEIAPSIVVQPKSAFVTAGREAVLTVETSGNPVPSCQWRFRNVSLDAPPSSVLRLPNVFTNQAGDYSVVASNSHGAVTSAVAVLTVAASAPTFRFQPENQTFLEGSDGAISASVESAPASALQWYANRSALPGATNEYLGLPGISPGQAGQYVLVASNALSTATSVVASITVTQQIPTLLSLPRNYRVEAGKDLNLCPEIRAGPPASYQWQHDGLDLLGATDRCLNLFHVMPADEGVYSLVASNRMGLVTGIVATLTVPLAAPSDARLLLSTSSVVEGNPVLLSAQCAGAPPPDLRLQINGTNLFLPWTNLYLASETAQGLAILEATPSDAGEYTLVASNSAGVLTSEVAQLTVTPAGPLDRWLRRNPQPLGYNLLAVAEGNNTLVAVGDRGSILTSPDGAHWTVQPLRADVPLLDAAFGQGTFVAGGGAGTILTSPDGTQWTLRSSGQEDPVVSIVHADGRFLAMSQPYYNQATAVLTSTNGSIWTRQYLPRPFQVRDLAWGNGLFVAVGYGPEIWMSRDGTVWSSYPVLGCETAEWECIASLDNRFVAVGDNGKVLVSLDGTTWTCVATATTRRLLGVAHGKGRYVAVGARGTILASTDTVHWTNIPSGTPDRLETVLFAGDQFVALGENGTTLTSPDGAAWTRQNLGTTRDLDGLAVGNGTVVVVGKNGTVLTSTNGIDYQQPGSGTTDNLHGVAFDHGLFLAVGEPGTVLASTDGSFWAHHPTGSRASLKRTAFGNNLWVAVGTEGTVLTSPDATQWTQRDAGTFNDLNDIAFGNGTFVVVGDRIPPNGEVITSTDGVTWTDHSVILGKNLRAVTFASGHFMALGNDGVILVSTNGVFWENRNSGLYRDGDNLRAVTYAHGTWIVTGNDGLILTSPDSYHWDRRASRTLENLHAVVALADRFVAIGNRGNVLQSGSLAGALLSVPTFDPERRCSITVEGDPGQQHRLQGSTDLRAWTDILTFRTYQTTTLLLDEYAPLHLHRFYRVITP